jgi:hypothetical protein
VEPDPLVRTDGRVELFPGNVWVVPRYRRALLGGMRNESDVAESRVRDFHEALAMRVEARLDGDLARPLRNSEFNSGGVDYLATDRATAFPWLVHGPSVSPLRNVETDAPAGITAGPLGTIHVVVNTKGHVESLVASHPGNMHRLRHGVFSEDSRALAPRAREIADAILSSPTLSDIDAFAADEVGRLLALIEALDVEIEARGVTGRTGDARAVVKLRLSASSRLQSWLQTLGLTPRSRAELVSAAATGSLATELARRRRDDRGR